MERAKGRVAISKKLISTQALVVNSDYPAGYCVHSTVVPAIVPKKIWRQVRRSMGRNYCFPMVGGAINRGKARHMIGQNLASTDVLVVFFF